MDTTLIAPVSSAVAALAAVGAAVSSWRNRRAIQEVHISINSRMDTLLALTAKASHAEGVIEGVAEAGKKA